MIVAPILIAQALGADPSPVEAASRLAEISSLVLQLRYQLTRVTVQPALTSIVQSEFPDAAVSADTLRAIHDTTRAQDGLRMRRILLEVETHPVPELRGELELDFAPLLYGEQGHSHGAARPLGLVEEAYGDYRPFSALTVRAGFFHVPFSLFELGHEPDFEFAEAGALHELAAHLRYTGGEAGVTLEVTPLRVQEWVRVSLGAFDGGATGAQKYPGPGLVAGRVESRPLRQLRVGAGAAWRPHALATWWEEYRFRYQAYDDGLAYGADAELSSGPIGLLVEGLAGDRTDNDVTTPLLQRRGDARTFMGAWTMVSAKFKFRGIVVTPALRAEWLDTDREHDDGGGIIQFGAAANIDFSEQWRLLWDLSQRYVQPGTRNWNFNLVRYDTDATTAVVQLQLRL